MNNIRIRTDIVPEELLEAPEKITIVTEDQIRVEASRLFSNIVNTAQKLDRTVTPGKAKDIVEVTDLIEQAIVDYDKRFGVTKGAKVEIVYERPEKEFDDEVIAISFATREPGMVGQGRPFENKTKNLRPILREILDDPEYLGYKKAILGYYYDNIIRLTCWARTNKTANKRAIWLENLMEQYTWWFAYSGVNRIFYEGWRTPVLLDINNQRFYGRPIDFYVRTEKLFHMSQKKIEEILISLTLNVSSVT
jgi:hypothetical protein